MRTGLSEGDKVGVRIILWVMFLFGLLVVIALYMSFNKGDYDVETLCPSCGGYPIVHILVDKTDPWNTYQSKKFGKIVCRIRDGLSVHERMRIFILDESGNVDPQPLFDMCNPGRGSQVSPLYNNPRRVQDRFNAKFGTPLEGILKSLMEPGIAPISPIIETIENLGDIDQNKKLVIVSDLMQHTKIVSFYTHIPNFDEWKRSKTSKINVCYNQVVIYLVDRNVLLPYKKERLKKFWGEFLCEISDTVVWKKL